MAACSCSRELYAKLPPIDKGAPASRTKQHIRAGTWNGLWVVSRSGDSLRLVQHDAGVAVSLLIARLLDYLEKYVR